MSAIQDEPLQQIENNNVPTPEVLMPQLAWLVRRYSIVVDVFSHSLTDEFWPSKETAADWVDNLGLLREATFPIANFLHKCRSFLPKSDHHVRMFVAAKRRVTKAISCLLSLTECSSVDDSIDGPKQSNLVAKVLVTANFELRQASSVLREWLNDLGSQEMQVDAGDFSPSRRVAIGLLDHHQRRLDSSFSSGVSNQEVYRQCMASRKLFLVAHYVACIYPDLWTPDRYFQLLRSQEKLIGRMHEGSPHRLSVIKRWRLIEHSKLLGDTGSEKFSTSEVSR